MMQGHDGAMEEHARPAPTHDSAYLLAHIAAVAVDGARGAEGFHIHARAADDAVACVVEETAAVRAERRRSVSRRSAVGVSLTVMPSMP